MFRPRSKDCGFPIDCIVEAGSAMVLCSYKHSNGNREGRLQFVDKDSMESRFEIQTSGTLHAFHQCGRIYCADSRAITAHQDFRIVASLETESLNTYISGGDCIYAASISGEIRVLDSDLRLVESVRVSCEPVWVVKQFGDCLYFGDESGCCYRYNRVSRIHTQIGRKRLGILDIFFDEDLILVSSYDDNLEVYCLNTLELKETKRHVGSLWKIEKTGKVFVCACMYEGMKIFDGDFNLLCTYKTNSICYGLCIVSKMVFWSSFYDNTVFWASLDELLPGLPASYTG